MNRKNALLNMAVATSGLFLSGNLSAGCETKRPITDLKGKVLHSACKWCYHDIPLEQFIEHAKDIGLSSIELLDPTDWEMVVSRGLTCAMGNGSPLHIRKGFNNPQYHEQLYKDYMRLIPKAAESGLTQLICFSGDHHTTSEKEGMDNCARGLEPVVKEAEKYGISICMELLNSKVNHQGYQCDHTEWGVQLAEKLGADNFKLLYDIYHMQIMEGDVIATIRKNHKYIAHYHTGGVPGRHEIDETQELFYPAIVKAIVDTGFNGHIAQEFIPSWDNPISALKKGVDICDI